MFPYQDSVPQCTDVDDVGVGVGGPGLNGVLPVLNALLRFFVPNHPRTFEERPIN